MCSGCCVALPLSHLQRLLCGLLTYLSTAVAVLRCPYPVCSACCVFLPLPVYTACCLVLYLSVSILCTAVAVWHYPYPVYKLAMWHGPYPNHSACCGHCVILLLSYVQRLLCDVSPVLLTVLVLPVSCLKHLLGCFVSFLCTTVAVWHCPYPVYSPCCAVLLPSYEQRLLCGIAPAVWSCFYLMYSGCCVFLLLSYF